MLLKKHSRIPTGTSESRVKAVLGKPTKTFKGYWSNTRAVHYTRIRLLWAIYLIAVRDAFAKQRPFDQSVEPEVMQETLQGMLGDHALLTSIKDCNEFISRANNYSFNTGGLKV